MYFSHISHTPMLSSAIIVQLKKIEELRKRILLTHAALATKDADTILKTLRSISSLCDVFQVSFSSYQQKLRVYIDHFLKMDTQLNIEITVGEIVQVLYFRYPVKYG